MVHFITKALLFSFQGPAGLKGGEGLPGVGGSLVSLVLLNPPIPPPAQLSCSIEYA